MKTDEMKNLKNNRNGNINEEWKNKNKEIME